jgi:hypothetical protein
MGPFLVGWSAIRRLWQGPGKRRNRTFAFWGTSGHIFDFAWTRDGKQLLLSKGEETSDVLLVSNFR